MVIQSRKELLTMVMITTTIYFSNNVMIHRQVSLRRAVSLMDHASAIVPPEAELHEVHSPSLVVLVPSQIIFAINRAFIPQLPQPNKRSIYERENGHCAYCDRWISYAAATLDHIVPQSLGGGSTWDNLVNCCQRCNQRKGGRTPEQAHMQLLIRPGPPKVRLRAE
jgi:5-methylcytosine-specific restriction endonuclease McrA